MLEAAVGVEEPGPGRRRRRAGAPGRTAAASQPLRCASMSLLRNSRMSPRADACPRVVECRPIEGPWDRSSTRDVGAVGQPLDQREGLRVGGPVVDEHELDAGVHARWWRRWSPRRCGGAAARRGRGSGCSPGRRSGRPAQCGSRRARGRATTAASSSRRRSASCMWRTDAGPVPLRRVPADRWQSTSGMWVTASADLGGRQRAFVLERGRAGRHEPGQVVRHRRPDGEGAADVGGGQEEFGREVGLEAWRRPTSRRPPPRPRPRRRRSSA